jgi:cyclophilin family peptidyl-prolyl cis-trans isomerase
MSHKFAPAFRPLRCTVLAFLLVATLVSGQTTPAKKTFVAINTPLGRMVVELYNETPKHRDNFLKLVREHYYDSTLFHRVIPDFMVQGGDPNSREATAATPLGNGGGPGYTIPAEFNTALIHSKGALAAARLDDQQNPEKASSGSQFYIVQGRSWPAEDLNRWIERKKTKDPNYPGYTPEQMSQYVKLGGVPHLDGDYTVFGRVVEGLEVLDQLAKVPCNAADRPVEDVRIWMRVIE